MTTTVVKTVGSSGRDYATAALYAAYVNPIDLNGTDTIQEADFYNDSEFAVAGQVVSISPAADTNHYVALTTGAGQSFRDNAGVRTNALFYNASNGVGLRDTASSSSICVQIDSPAMKISNLQIKTDDLAGSLINLTSGSNDCTFTNCIFHGSSPFSQAANLTFINCLFVNTASAAFGCYGNSGGTNVQFKFCTFICNPSLTYYMYNDTTATYTNCAFFGGGTSAFNATTPTSDTFVNCMTDITGTTGLTGGKTFANQFVSTTIDFRVKSGSDLINAGTPIGGITTDISGFTRNVSTPTIGAWEFDSSGATVVLMGQAVF